MSWLPGIIRLYLSLHMCISVSVSVEAGRVGYKSRNINEKSPMKASSSNTNLTILDISPLVTTVTSHLVTLLPFPSIVLLSPPLADSQVPQ